MYGMRRTRGIIEGGGAIGLNRQRVYVDLIGKDRLEFFYGLLDFLRAAVLWFRWQSVLRKNRCPPVSEAQPVRVCCRTDTKETDDDGRRRESGRKAASGV